MIYCVGSTFRAAHWRRSAASWRGEFGRVKRPLLRNWKRSRRAGECWKPRKSEALLYEQRRPDLVDIVKLERIALAIVVPDPTPEAREAYDKDIEAIAMRIAKKLRDRPLPCKSFRRVVTPSCSRLRSGKPPPNGEKIVIEVKGRAGRGAIQLTDNEWPTAANVRDKYWLYVVVDCATDPKLFRVQDPIRLAFKTTTVFHISTSVK